MKDIGLLDCVPDIAHKFIAKLNNEELLYYFKHASCRYLKRHCKIEICPVNFQGVCMRTYAMDEYAKRKAIERHKEGNKKCRLV